MNKHVLWIEDEIYKFQSLVNVLLDEKIKVTTAETEQEWEEALAKKAGFYDLVILDIGLTRSTLEPYEKWSRRGEQLLKGIRKQWPEVPVIVFTGILPSNDEKRIKELGAEAFLEKPVLLKEFKDTIFKSLGLEKDVE